MVTFFKSNFFDIFLGDRIVGGRDSSSDNWPSIVGIFKDGSHICGGVIISEQWIVTAAHCFDDEENKHNYYEV